MRAIKVPTNFLPKPTEAHTTPENPQGWHVHSAYGAFYVANRFGSFTRYGSEKRAQAELVIKTIKTIKTPAQIAPVREDYAA